MEQRVKTQIWVQAFVRRSASDGFPAALIQRGDADAGAVLIKVNRFENGCRVYTQVRDDNGNPAWMAGTGSTWVPEQEADAYIARQRQYDADVWVVEVEDPKNTYGLDGIILDS